MALVALAIPLVDRTVQAVLVDYHKAVAVVDRKAQAVPSVAGSTVQAELMADSWALSSQDILPLASHTEILSDLVSRP